MRRSRNIEDRRGIRVPRKAAAGGIGIIVIALIAMYFGISQKVQSIRRRVSQVEGNKLSVMLELQADCFAGIWAHHAQRARQILEEGDLEEALNAASAIGDDRLQQRGRGYVTPDSFAHGSSRQRVHWFKQGIETGDISQCNTFKADNL